MGVIENLVRRLRGDTQQFLILTRHFFHRFFQNDVVDFEDQMKEKVIMGMAFLAILGGHLANSILLKYIFQPEEGLSWVEKCYFIFFFMIVLGFIAVIEWDIIFPDRRDYLNFMPLPVRIRTFFMGKFASFFLFIALYSLAANALAGFVFGFFLSAHRSKSVLFALRYVLAHLVSATAANIFFFFCCGLIQGILMCFLSYRFYRSVSLIVRFLLLTSFVFILMISLTKSVTLPGALSNFPMMKDSQDSFLFSFPPMWFAGLYEMLLGNPDPFFAKLSRLALLSTALAILAFFVTAAASYRKYLKKSLEVKRSPVTLKKLANFTSFIFDSLFLRNPTQRAVFHFFGQTLAKSAFHKMRLLSYMAVSSGLGLILLASTKLLRSQMTISNKTLLSLPLILAFFLLIGMRSLANVPSSLEANWAFRISEREPRRHYFSGFKKGIFFLTLLPLFIPLYLFYFYLWGWKFALLHILFGLASSLWLLEILFFGYPKIPFACTYVPGKAKLHLYWLVYVLAFIAYVLFFSRLESSLFSAPGSFYYFYGVMGILVLAMKVYEDIFIYRKQPIRYEDEPEPVMIVLETPS